MFQVVSADYRRRGLGLGLPTEEKWHGQIFMTLFHEWIHYDSEMKRLTVDLEPALGNDS